jgi:hypothetical protein
MKMPLAPFEGVECVLANRMAWRPQTERGFALLQTATAEFLVFYSLFFVAFSFDTVSSSGATELKPLPRYDRIDRPRKSSWHDLVSLPLFVSRWKEDQS